MQWNQYKPGVYAKWEVGHRQDTETGEYEYFWSVNDVTIYRQSNPVPFVWHGPNTYPPATIEQKNTNFAPEPEEKMYDGDLNTYSHTAHHKNVEYTVTFDDPQTLWEIRIYKRLDCCHDRYPLCFTLYS